MCSKTTWLWMGLLFISLYTPLSTLISYVLRHYIYHWRHIHLANMSMLLVLPLIFWYVPESPRWLMFVGNRKAAWKSLQQCGLTEEPSIAGLSISDYKRPTVPILLKEICRSLFRKRLLICVFFFFLQSIAMNVETKILTRDVQVHTREFYTIATCFQLGFIVLACLLAIKHGRRETVTLTWSMLSIINASMFMVAHYLQSQAVFIILLDAHLAMSQAMARVMTFYIIELFPTPYRFTALSLCQCSYSFGATLQKHLYNVMYPHDSSTAYMPGYIAAIFCVLLTSFLPRTRNNGLPDVPREAIYLERRVTV